jgi:hypothetical protein
MLVGISIAASVWIHHQRSEAAPEKDEASPQDR